MSACTAGAAVALDFPEGASILDPAVAGSPAGKLATRLPPTPDGVSCCDGAMKGWSRPKSKAWLLENPPPPPQLSTGAASGTKRVPPQSSETQLNSDQWQKVLPPSLL